jgi:TatD DNase family protein
MKPLFLVDTHTHLDFDRFDNDREAVIERARDENVKAMLTIGIDYQTSQAAIQIAEEHKNIFAAVGFHPHDAKTMTDEYYQELALLLSHPKVVAIGEVGLDYHYDYSPRDVQRRVFRQFLDLSLETQMPLIIHTRESDEDILETIQNRAKKGWHGVFHCFSGDVNMAHRVLELGFLISFTGNITFKNSRAMRVMEQVPLEKLMIETDSPFMAPTPHRGKRNEPAFVKHVAEKIAEVKGVPYEKVVEITTQNAIHLFDLEIEASQPWPGA